MKFNKLAERQGKNHTSGNIHNHRHGQQTKKKLFKEHFADLTELLFCDSFIFTRKKETKNRKINGKWGTSRINASFYAIAANIPSGIFYRFHSQFISKILLRSNNACDTFHSLSISFLFVVVRSMLFMYTCSFVLNSWLISQSQSGLSCLHHVN